MRRKAIAVATAWLLTSVAANAPADAATASEDDGSALVVFIPGDFNGDGAVTDADYAIFRVAYSATVEPGTVADGNGDGVVDAADYTVWRDAREGLFVAAVPEPASALIAALAVAAAAMRRRA